MPNFPPPRFDFGPYPNRPQSPVSFGLCSQGQIDRLSKPFGNDPPPLRNIQYGIFDIPGGPPQISPQLFPDWLGYGWNNVIILNNEKGELSPELAPYLFPDEDIITLVIGMSVTPAVPTPGWTLGFFSQWTSTPPADVTSPTDIFTTNTTWFGSVPGTLILNIAEFPSLSTGGQVIAASGPIAPNDQYDITSYVTGYTGSSYYPGNNSVWFYAPLLPIYGNGLPPAKITTAQSIGSQWNWTYANPFPDSSRTPYPGLLPTFWQHGEADYVPPYLINVGPGIAIAPIGSYPGGEIEVFVMGYGNPPTAPYVPLAGIVTDQDPTIYPTASLFFETDLSTPTGELKRKLYLFNLFNSVAGVFQRPPG